MPQGPGVAVGVSVGGASVGLQGGVAVGVGVNVLVAVGVNVVVEVAVAVGVAVAALKTMSAVRSGVPPAPLVVAATWAVPGVVDVRWATAIPLLAGTRAVIVPRSVLNVTKTPSVTGALAWLCTVAVMSTVLPTAGVTSFAANSVTV